MLKSINIQLNYFTHSSGASGYAHLGYSADTSSNEAASLVTRMDGLEAELSIYIWFKKKINQDDASRLIDSVSPHYREYLKNKRLLAKHT